MKNHISVLLLFFSVASVFSQTLSTEFKLFEKHYYSESTVNLLKAGTLKSTTANQLVSADKQDSLALVELYSSTNGDNWKNSTGWLVDSVYKWYGVELDAAGRVTGIDLSGNDLTGQLPVSISNLAGLNYLYLHNNSITGDIPEGLAALNNIKALYLTGNYLTGSIPKEIGSLAGLIWLGLGSNNLSGELPVELFQLENLEFFDVSTNQLNGNIPVTISNLVNLKALCFEENHFTGSIPEETGSLLKLEQLALYRNDFSGVIPAELGELSNLKQLYLHLNALSGEVPAELKNLSQLECLYLSHNKLTGIFPEWVCDLTGMKELFLTDNNFTGEIPADVSKLKSLVLLGLNNNSFGGEIPVELSELTNLIGLYLSDNSFEGAIPSSLGLLTNLQELWLSSNNLSGDVPAELGNLTDVYRLLLSENNFTSLPDLSGLVLDSALFVQDNSLDFGDLESAKIDWSHVNEYSYAPQADVSLNMSENGDDTVFSVDVAGVNNKYSWLRDGVIIDGENSNTLTVNRVDAGEYRCLITNDDFPDLTLTSVTKEVVVYSVEFSVVDGFNPIENAKVSLTNYGDIYTDANGIAVFNDVAPENDIDYSVTASGFSDASGAVSVVDSDVEEDVVMSVPTAISINEGAGLVIHPNPIFSKMYISSDESINEVQVYSLTGKLVMSRTNTGVRGEVDMSELKRGVYLVVVRTDAGFFNKKVIKR